MNIQKPDLDLKVYDMCIWLGMLGEQVKIQPLKLDTTLKHAYLYCSLSYSFNPYFNVICYKMKEVTS